MLSESRLKGKHPCVIFVKVHITDNGSLEKRMVMIKTKNQMTLMPRCTGQNAQNIMNMNMIIHVMIHHI